MLRTTHAIFAFIWNYLEIKVRANNALERSIILLVGKLMYGTFNKRR